MNISKTELLETVAKLDPTSDADWTAEGLPSVERVGELALDDTITRDDITVNALGFDREVSKNALAAAGEVAADDATKAGAAKPLDQASKDAAASVAKVAAAFTETKARSNDERRADLVEIVTAAKNELEQFDLALSRQRQMRDELVKAVDTATKDLEHEFPPLKHADIVRQWLTSEAAKRAAASDQGQRPGIDQRFQRRMGYGGGRPNIPPVETHAR